MFSAHTDSFLYVGISTDHWLHLGRSNVIAEMVGFLEKSNGGPVLKTLSADWWHEREAQQLCLTEFKRQKIKPRHDVSSLNHRCVIL